MISHRVISHRDSDDKSQITHDKSQTHTCHRVMINARHNVHRETHLPQSSEKNFLSQTNK